MPVPVGRRQGRPDFLVASLAPATTPASGTIRSTETHPGPQLAGTAMRQQGVFTIAGSRQWFKDGPGWSYRTDPPVRRRMSPRLRCEECVICAAHA